MLHNWVVLFNYVSGNSKSKSTQTKQPREISASTLLKLNCAKEKYNAIFEINNLKKANENLVKKVHSLQTKMSKTLKVQPSKSTGTQTHKELNNKTCHTDWRSGKDILVLDDKITESINNLAGFKLTLQGGKKVTVITLDMKHRPMKSGTKYSIKRRAHCVTSIVNILLNSISVEKLQPVYSEILLKKPELF